MGNPPRGRDFLRPEGPADCYPGLKVAGRLATGTPGERPQKTPEGANLIGGPDQTDGAMAGHWMRQPTLRALTVAPSVRSDEMADPFPPARKHSRPTGGSATAHNAVAPPPATLQTAPSGLTAACDSATAPVTCGKRKRVLATAPGPLNQASLWLFTSEFSVLSAAGCCFLLFPNPAPTGAAEAANPVAANGVSDYH
jgi:hypothetical protein